VQEGVVVLANEDAVPMSGDLAHAIARLLFADTAAARPEEQAREIFAGLQQGKIDRSLLTENCNSYFTDQALKEFGNSLGSLGIPKEFKQTDKLERGGMTLRVFELTFPERKLEIWERIMPDGKIEQYQVGPK
jgi:D-alanyl-D-alanine carboxypeptidase